MRDPADELHELGQAGLRRRLREIDSPQGTSIRFPEGKKALNFSSNDYLGLANDEELKSAFQENIARYGNGSGASRLICGTLGPHRDLEEQLAAFKNTEAALTFSTGFATAIGVIPALCGKGDIIILDKLCHASLIDGARLSGATMRIFPHNDLNKLADHLQWAEKKIERSGRILVATESVFSMDGDRAPLREIVELKEEKGALLLVDEAHAYGVIGPDGRGLGAELGMDNRIDLQMGTFSKSAGLSGGYVCAGKGIVDLLVNKARSFIYSTAPSPGLAATIGDGLQIISGERGAALRSKLWSNIEQMNPDAASAILPIIIGENKAALEASQALLDQGFLVPAIRFPTVPRGTARLRVTVSAAHRTEDVESLSRAIDT